MADNNRIFHPGIIDDSPNIVHKCISSIKRPPITAAHSRKAHYNKMIFIRKHCTYKLKPMCMSICTMQHDDTLIFRVAPFHIFNSCTVDLNELTLMLFIERIIEPIWICMNEFHLLIIKKR